MRGDETVDYVARIRDRWAQYRGVAHGGFSGFYGPATHRKPSVNTASTSDDAMSLSPVMGLDVIKIKNGNAIVCQLIIY